MPSLQLGDLEIKLPLIQGGMGVGISLSGLASAVANEGGVGVISAVGVGMTDPSYETDSFNANMMMMRKEIRAARKLSKGVLGVNIMVALSDYGEYIKVAQEEGIDIIFSGAGLPLSMPETLKPGKRPKLVPIVSSLRAASTLCRKWERHYGFLPDAFVIEGPMAGGHLGFSSSQINDPAYALPVILKELVDGLRPFAEQCGRPIPVIAAGGIFTGGDIRRYIDMGASGVQMGTRFVGTKECDASDAFKQAYLNCVESDICIIDSPVGMPGRAISNEFLRGLAAKKGQRIRCPYACIASCHREDAAYCIARALMNAMKGDLSNGFAFAGANAYRVKEIISVHELVEKLREEYRRVS